MPQVKAAAIVEILRSGRPPILLARLYPFIAICVTIDRR